MNDTVKDRFEECNSPNEPLDTLIISKAYPKELSEKLNGSTRVIVDFYNVGSSTILRINGNDGFHAVYAFMRCNSVLSENECVEMVDYMIAEDTAFVESMAS
tara:strand:- start:98 stop:403 length:306 start_codon:yes stop_codon:yes gene_type:complete